MARMSREMRENLARHMDHRLRSRMRHMARNLENHVPELMEPSPLVDQDGIPYPDIPSGIFGKFIIHELSGEVSIEFPKIPRRLTAVAVRLVKLDENGGVEKEVPFLTMGTAKDVRKGDSLKWPIPLTVKPQDV